VQHAPVLSFEDLSVPCAVSVKALANHVRFPLNNALRFRRSAVFAE
jgi:hypothetical protein